MTEPNNPNSERVLVLAPQGRDAAIAMGLLADAGIRSLKVDDLNNLHQALDEVAGVVLLTEEAVRTADLTALNVWLTDQPPWSDMPFVLLALRH